MPEHYLIPKRIARTAPTLSKFIAGIEASLLLCWTHLLRALPPGVASRLASSIFGFFGPSGDKGIKAERNLRIAFPDHNDHQINDLIKKTFQHLGLANVELAQAERAWEQRESRFEVQCEDPEIEALLKPGRAAVLVTAHVGAWQYTVMLSTLLGLELTSLYAPESNPRIGSLLLRLRKALRCNWISRDSSMRPLMKELSAGRCVGLVTDIRVDQGETLAFFGQPAATNVVPAKLALRYQCPLISVRCDRLPGHRYRLVLSKIFHPGPGDSETQIRQMSSALNREFESWITRNPGQWLCLSRRWPKEIERGCANAK